MFKSVKYIISAFALSVVFAPASYAGECGEYVFKHAMFRKYQYAQNTMSQNARKYGISTSSKYTTETTTAITDPGVTTGVSASSGQAVSSIGPCAAIKKWRSADLNKKYIEQNLDEIKMEMAKGRGAHLTTIAYFSGCEEMATEKFITKINQEYDRFAAFKDHEGDKFYQQLSRVITADKFLSKNCQMQLL